MGVFKRTFRLTVCEPDAPYTDLADLGDITFAITTYSAWDYSIGLVATTVAAVRQAFSDNNVDTSELYLTYGIDDRASSSVKADQESLIGVMPAIVDNFVEFGFSNWAIHAQRKLKLTASDGAVAISYGVITANALFPSSTSPLLYYPYINGELVTRSGFYVPPLSGRAVVMMIPESALVDGQLVPTGNSGIIGNDISFIWQRGGLYWSPVGSVTFGNGAIDFLNGIPADPEPSTDPYEPGGYSGTGGGGGGQNFASTPIGRTPLPTLSFADTGFCRIYNPTLSELQALANYMWTDDTFLQTVVNHAKQLLEDPIEAIISLSLVPVPVPNGTAQEVKVLFIPTGVSMPPVTNQFVEVDCGTLSLPVEDQYGAALDFNPYTKIDLYLPYIGQVSIDVDEVMYKTMHCVYRVDVVTGMCVAIISVGTGTDETVLYQFAGHCGVQMPLNSADFSGWVGAIVTAAKTIGGLAAAGAGGGGAAAALIGGPTPVTSKTTRITQGGGHNFQSSQTVRNPATGRQVTAGTMKAERVNLPEVTTSVHESSPASFGELAFRGAVNTVDSIIGSKMHFEHAGSFSGNSGYIAGVRRPYAILKRPRQCYPENYASYRGFPAMIYMSLGDCVGYTEVHDIHLTGISATNPELGELAQLLKTGVIL